MSAETVVRAGDEALEVHPALTGLERRRRLARARLSLIGDARPAGRPLEDLLKPALSAGVDVFQLRDKRLGDAELLAVARRAQVLTRAAGALLIINDRPDLAAAVDADGVHIGQDDGGVAQARRWVGGARLVGLSTHSARQVADAHDGVDVDYIGVGPVHATPTKPGRRAVGLRLIRHAAQHATLPFFAIGGIDATNVGAVVDAGARRIAVVRAVWGPPGPSPATSPASAVGALLHALAAAPPDAEHPLASSPPVPFRGPA